MHNVDLAAPSALFSRVNDILKSDAYRDCILKSHVLNEYVMMITGSGMQIDLSTIGKVNVKTFEEIIDVNPKTAMPKLLNLRRGLIHAYPFWIPNIFHYAIELSNMAKAYREQAREACLAALPYVENMVIDSDHYAQMYIDCRYFPTYPRPWHDVQTNAKPWAPSTELIPRHTRGLA